MSSSSLPVEVARLKRQLAQVKKGQRLSHGASIENAAVEVRDDSGRLRTILGVQGDGTVGVQAVNGPPPPAPSAPVVASVIGGVTASWDGGFADGAVIPMDWARVEVHASTSPDFVPDPVSLQSTIETAQGGTVVVPCQNPVYVCLVARNTSGAASDPSVVVGPFGPKKVVADEVLDGIVTTVKLADDAVTAAKIATGAVGTTALADGAVLAEKLADAAVQVGKLATNAVTGPAIASEAVTAGKLAANAVTAQKIQAGAVTAAALAAGAVTTDKLTVVGSGNILNDPSFEGTYAASVAARFSQWTVQDKAFGNGSPASLKITTDGTAQWRAVELALLPTTAGDKLYIAVDYYAAANWAGSELNMHVRWETENGTTLTTDKTDTRATSPVKGAWTRLAGTYTAPATAVRARVRVETGLVTAGDTWFDNAVCRPVVPGVQIADGAITAPKIVAGSVQTAALAADSVAAGKIAANAVTAREIAALAVTADKIDANAITASKIKAGAVDATALAADAITGKTITGGSITGTTVTGGLIQTAASGQRITLNEADANKIIVYNTSGTAIGELSPQGLLLQGTNGAMLMLDPNDTFPNMRLTNAARTNSAVINVSSNNAVLGMNSGTFPASGATWKWRTMFGQHNSGNEYWVTERIQDSDNSVFNGGRIFLSPTNTAFGYRNSADPNQDAYLYLEQGLAQLIQCRLQILPPASDLSALYVNAASGYTGNLLRLLLNGSEKFVVDKDGNTSIAGTLTAGNEDKGTVDAVMSGAASVDVTVTFSKTFPTTPRVIATLRGNPTLPSGSSALTVRAFNITTTGCTLRVNDVGGAARTLTHAVDWIARS